MGYNTWISISLLEEATDCIRQTQGVPPLLFVGVSRGSKEQDHLHHRTSSTVELVWTLGLKCLGFHCFMDWLVLIPIDARHIYWESTSWEAAPFPLPKSFCKSNSGLDEASMIDGDRLGTSSCRPSQLLEGIQWGDQLSNLLGTMCPECLRVQDFLACLPWQSWTCAAAIDYRLDLRNL